MFKCYKRGWRAIGGFYSDETAKDSEKDNEGDSNQVLPELVQGESIKIKAVEILSKTTQPPALYTESGLLGAMETAGKTLEDKAQRELFTRSRYRYSSHTCRYY